MAIYIQQPVFLHELGKRSNNEDYIYPYAGAATPEDRLFIVCDGVGGASKGEIASRMACDLFQAYFAENEPETVVDKAYISKALSFVEEKMTEHISQNGQCLGMATTLTLLYIDDKRDEITIAWIGDSRVYHVREGKVMYVTQDHSLINELVKRGEVSPEEAATHPQRNVILRAISGSENPTKAEVVQIKDIQPNDYFLLCTDGVLESVETRLIATLLKSKNADLQAVNQQIKDMCAENSKDNHSLYLFQIADIKEETVTEVLGDENLAAKTKVLSASFKPPNSTLNTTPIETINKNNKKLIYLLATFSLLVLLFIGVYKWYEIKTKNEYHNYIASAEQLIHQGKLMDAQSLLVKAKQLCPKGEELAAMDTLIVEQKEIRKLLALQIENKIYPILGDSSLLSQLGEDSSSLKNKSEELLDNLNLAGVNKIVHKIDSIKSKTPLAIDSTQTNATIATSNQN